MPFWLTVVPYLTAFSPAHPTLEGNWGTGPPTPLRVAVPLPVGCCWLLPNKDPFGQVKTKGNALVLSQWRKSAACFIFGELEKCDVSKYLLFSPRFWGNDPIWWAYVSNGLKPPTSLYPSSWIVIKKLWCLHKNKHPLKTSFKKHSWHHCHPKQENNPIAFMGLVHLPSNLR